MKERHTSIFSILLALLLMAGLLAGCGSNPAKQQETATETETSETAETAKPSETSEPAETPEPEETAEEEPLPESDPEEESLPVSLAGAWDNDQEELSMVLERDGSMVIGGEGETLELLYAWDGTNLSILLPEGGEVAAGVMDAQGDLILEDFTGYFYRVGSASYLSEDPATDSGEAGFDLAQTAWEVDETVFQFYVDNVVIVEEYTGSYTWDGQQGEIQIGGETAALLYDGERLLMEGEDGSLYPCTYYGEADVSIRGDIGWDVLDGAYDNDTAEISIVFYQDGTFTASDQTNMVEGTYTFNSESELCLEYGGDTEEGTYDFSDDTFVMDSADGYFYRVEAASYKP